MNSTPNYGSIPSSSSSFSPTEFLILKEQISTNLIIIKKSAQKLEKITKAIGTKSDTQELRNKINVIEKNTNEQIKATSSLIKKLNSIVKFSSEKVQRIQTEKIMSEFTLAAQRFLQSEKQLNSKIRRIVLVDLEDDTSSTSNTQQQQQLHADIKFDNELLINREENILKIEDDVNEISQIMSQVATLINDQGENVETIGNLVNDVENNIEDGTAELDKALSNQQKIRKKAFIIFIICLIIVFIIALIIYKHL